VVLIVISAAVTVIVFLVWLRRARIGGVLTDGTSAMPADRAGDIQPREFMPLRTLADALIVLLASTIGLTGAERIFVSQRDLTWEIGTHTQPLVVLSVISAAATVVVFLVWFRRARINAEHLGWRQRRARGWAFWGWVVPIVNLWIPFQIMGDIWRAGVPPAQRSGTAWLPVSWWVCWLLTAPPLWIRIGSLPRSAADGLTHGWLSFVFFALAGLALITIVRTVSNGPVGIPDPMTNGNPF